MNKLRLIFLLLLPQLSFAIVCHPKIDNRVPQYIIGYGSLMDEHSKKETDATAQENIPVLIKGYARSWSVYGTLPGLNTTFLSVSKNKHASLNGVIYLLKNPENIQLYDAREDSYCRKEVTPREITLYSGALPNQKQMWIYSSAREQHQYPTKDHPIVQSYVDIFIRGCIQIEEKFKINGFAKNCIKSTGQWSKHWVNDRIFPRRPWLYEPYASKIDALVKEMLPELFKHIKFE
jgi:cation transport regulator ChaC